MLHALLLLVVLFAHCIFTINGAGTLGTNPGSDPFTDGDQQTFVDQHNILRPFRGGSNMECMKGWDPALVTIAQNYANDCTVNHHTPVTSPVTSSCGGVIGEAVYFSPTKTNAPDTVFGIMAEGDFNYNHTTNVCNPNPTSGQSQTCDNYKQFAWYHMGELGCGRAECTLVEGRGEAGYIQVCVYSIKADLAVRPFTSGTACDTCPADELPCVNQLCCRATAAQCPSTTTGAAQSTTTPGQTTLLTSISTSASNAQTTTPAATTQAATTVLTTQAATTTTACTDDPSQSAICSSADASQCQRKPGKYLSICPMSCGSCHQNPPPCFDSSVFQCANYASFCKTYTLVKEYCPLTCGTCSPYVPLQIANPSSVCQNTWADSTCDAYVKQDSVYCSYSQVQKSCKKACGLCS